MAVHETLMKSPHVRTYMYTDVRVSVHWGARVLSMDVLARACTCVFVCVRVTHSQVLTKACTRRHTSCMDTTSHVMHELCCN